MNILAGSAGIPVRYFVPGTLVGAAPIVAVTVWGSSGLLRALRQPQDSRIWLTLLVVLAAGAALLGGRLYLKRRASTRSAGS
jgi:membrane protein DedA with SNARE-associated domain